MKMKFFSGSKAKTAIALTSLVLVLCAAVSPTLAFLLDRSDPIVNVFQESVVTSQVNEESFDETTKTNVTVKNTGDTQAWIRAAIIVTWKTGEDGDVYGGAPVAGTDYSISLNTTDWIKGSDGFYYHKAPVEPGQSTQVLIYSCSPVEAKTPEGYGLNVEIISSALQSKPARAFSKWQAQGVKVNDAGTALVAG